MSILRWRQVLLVAVLLLAAVLLVRSQPGPAADTVATPTPAAVIVVNPFVAGVAERFVAAYQSGASGRLGGPAWLAQLAPVTTPDLLAAVALVDPETISTAPVQAVATGPSTATVVLTDGTVWVLTITGDRVSAVGRG